ncbi:hypothetical protein ACFYT4_06975 [Streptomyces sp. NPDC004609]
MGPPQGLRLDRGGSGAIRKRLCVDAEVRESAREHRIRWSGTLSSLT